MKLLLDTCTFIWWMTEPARLSAKIRSLLLDQDNEIVLSSVSGWELSIKRTLGRLALPKPTAAFVADAVSSHTLTVLPITIVHGIRAGELPPHHKDPFDRMLIAQAEVEAMPLATPDGDFPPYGIKTIW